MDMKKVFLGLLVGLIGIGAIVYGGYYYSKNKSANPTTEIGENNPVTTENPPTAPVRQHCGLPIDGWLSAPASNETASGA